MRTFSFLIFGCDERTDDGWDVGEGEEEEI
jgi:hypothetical protein